MFQFEDPISIGVIVLSFIPGFASTWSEWWTYEGISGKQYFICFNATILKTKEYVQHTLEL